MNNTLPDPKTLARQTVDEIENTFKKKSLEETNILDALQEHYTTLQKNQNLYINYLTEFIDTLKKTQHADKESLANLKKQVLKHVLTRDSN